MALEQNKVDFWGKVYKDTQSPLTYRKYIKYFEQIYQNSAYLFHAILVLILRNQRDSLVSR